MKIESASEVIIHPTHSCFDDAIDYINFLATENPSDIQRMNKEYRVCHGICLFPDGEKYAHAWLEYRNSTIEGGIYDGQKVAVRQPKADFYKRQRPVKVLRYTIKQTIKLEKDIYGYCGPWDPEIRALCRDIQLKKRIDEVTRAMRA